MSFIGDAITSAMTGQGQNAADGQNQTNANVQGAASKDYAQLNPLILAQIQQAIAAQPLNQQTLANAFMLASPGSNQARKQTYANQVQSNTANNQKQANFDQATEGLSSGAQDGENIANENAANAAENSYDANIDSPAYHQAQAAQQLADIAQMQGIPALSQGASLTGQVYGSPQVQVQPGAGAAIGGILGKFVGANPLSSGGGDDDDDDDGGDD